MKKTILILCTLLVSLHSYAQQFQNPSFELWFEGDPIFWTTSEFYNPGSATQSTEAHEGLYALKLTGFADTIANQPYAGSDFTFTTMPEVLTFWVKGNLETGSFLSTSFNLVENDTAMNALAYGFLNIDTLTNIYQYKIMNVLPLLGPSLLGVASIFMYVGTTPGYTLSTNTQVWIDDLYLGPDNTALHPQKSDNAIEGIYPNPANENAFLTFNTKAAGQVNIALYDLTGNKVQDCMNESLPAGRFKVELNTSNLANGMYFCKANINSADFTIKLVVGK